MIVVALMYYVTSCCVFVSGYVLDDEKVLRLVPLYVL